MSEIKKLFKSFIFAIIRFSGFPYLFREILQKNKVTILFYHNITVDTAECNFKYLTTNYNIISMNDFIDSVKEKDTKILPKKALIITFDDGAIGNYDIVRVIIKFNIPVTIFLCSSLINTNHHFWFLFQNTIKIKSELKHKSNKERLSILSKAGFDPLMDFEYPQALQKWQIEEMKPYVNFQSHTVSHPILPRCNDEEARYEVFESKNMLENEYKLNINAIAYPDGGYSERDILLVKEAGYECGLTVDYGFNTLHSDLFKLKRLSSDDTSDMNEFVAKSSGFYSFLRTLNGHNQEYGHS